MLVVERLRPAPTVTSVDAITFPKALAVGVAQVLALVPGVSRSGATIVGGMLSGLEKTTAAEFSFFLSMPTMAAACLFDLKDTLKPEGSAGTGLVLTGQQWIVLGVGFVVSYVVALGVVAWFMHWVRRHGFIPFAIYRLIVGAAVLAALQFGWLA